MELRKIISEKIKDLRLSKRMSQKSLAKKLSCTESLISFIEKGQRPLTLEMAFKIEIALEQKNREISQAIIQAIFQESGGEGLLETSSIPVETSNKEFSKFDGKVIPIPAESLKGIYLRIE